MSATLDRLRIALSDRYAVDRELDSGGMATVFVAEDLKHTRQVAIKVLNPELAAAVGSDRFLREIQTTARLRHPNILPLYDSGEADGLLYYVMPLVGGGSLADRLKREKQLPIEDAVQIASEVAEALDAAHDEGVIHRDIKPANILLERGRAVVADFGVATAIAEAGGERLTQTGTAVGTPHYMSPEQVAGDAELDGRSDVYSLGCVLYEMLAGQPPFTGPSVSSVTRQHLVAEPRPLTEIRSTVPGPLEAAVARSLAKSPADRFRTGKSFLEGLRADGTEPPVGVQSVRLTRRLAWLLPVGLAVLAVAVASWPEGQDTADLSSSPGSDLPRVAVLRPEAIPPDSAEMVFAAGMQHAIITHLSQIAGLRVAPARSVAVYADASTPIRQIAEEQELDAVVISVVQRSGDQVDLTVSMVDSEDNQTWAEEYSRPYTPDEFRELQVDLASRIALVLGAELSADERTRIGSGMPPSTQARRMKPMRRLEADMLWATTPSDPRILELFERVVDLDPDYGIGWAGLAGVRSFASRAVRDLELRRAATEALTRAKRLAPDEVETHLADAYHSYLVLRDYTAALEGFGAVRSLMPSDPRAYLMAAVIQRRRGRHDLAFPLLERAAALEPRSTFSLFFLWDTAEALGHVDDSERYRARVMALEPDNATHYVNEYRRALYAEGDTAAAQDWIDASRNPIGFWQVASEDGQASLEYYHRQYDEYLELWTQTTRPGFGDLYRLFWIGHLSQLLGRDPDARIYGDSLVEGSRTYIAEVDEEEMAAFGWPRSWGYAMLGLGHALSGDASEAIAAANRALEVYSPRDDLQDLRRVQRFVLWSYVLVGDQDRALDLLDSIADQPLWYLLFKPAIELDPIYDSIRGEPRFRAIMDRYGVAGP